MYHDADLIFSIIIQNFVESEIKFISVQKVVQLCMYFFFMIHIFCKNFIQIFCTQIKLPILKGQNKHTKNKPHISLFLSQMPQQLAPGQTKS